MKKSTKKKYIGTEQLVFLVAMMAWKNYTDQLADFTDFNGKYTNTYGADAVAVAEAAAAMPAQSVRQAAPKLKRKQTQQATRKCLALYQTLLRYIDNAFAADTVKLMKQYAGAAYYARASKYNWKQLLLLCDAATAFIDKYSTELHKTGKGMPNDFATRFATARTDIDAALQAYNDEKQNIAKQAAAKTEAFNEVYATLVAMLKDGQNIFANNSVVKSLFVYSALAKKVTPAKKSGLRIEVREAVTMQPVTTTTFVFQPGNITAFVNAAGNAEVHLAKGVHSFVATTPGYGIVAQDNVEVKAGTMTRLLVLVNKIVAVA